MRIYLTHCSAKKDPELKASRRLTTPDQLYTAAPTQRFMRVCQTRNVHWAIFSDFYGVWLPNVQHPWYEKDPGRVTPDEFATLVRRFDRQLQEYEEVWFYYNPRRFHPLYKQLLDRTELRDRITRFTHIGDIL